MNKTIKPVVGIVTFFVVTFGAAFLVMIAVLWALFGFDFSAVFQTNIERNAAKIIGITFFLIGYVSGLWLWTFILQRLYSKQEIQFFFDKWFNIFPINKIIKLICGSR